LPNGSPREVTHDELRALLKSQKTINAAEVLKRSPN